MTTISADDVEKIARLSRLTLSPAEAAEYQRTLGDILNYIAQLDDVDTAGVEPLARVQEMAMLGRHDEITPSLPIDETLANAPDHRDEFFRVPRIIE